MINDLALLLSEAFLVVPGSDADRPPGPASRCRRDVTTFVGRERELASCGVAPRRDDVRLVTLTGPGGIGKTRLGAPGRRSGGVAGFEEGAAFVSLGSVATTTQWCPRSPRRSACGTTAASPVDALRADLADRSLLLVLDNFEHVMGAASLLPEILRDAGPG